VIEAVPNLGSQYTPHASECISNASAQAVGMGAGAGATAPILNLGCHFREQSKTLASVGVAAVNAAPNNPVLQQKGHEAVEDSIDLIYATDPSLYYMAKAKGRNLPAMPDRGVLDALPGGMVDNHITPVQGYTKPAYQPQPVTYQPQQFQPHSHPEYDKKIDNAFTHGMMK